MVDEEKRRLVNAGYSREEARQDPGASTTATPDVKIDWIDQ